MLTMIIGRRRQGKTTLAYALAQQSGKTIIIFDPNDQFGNVPVIQPDLEEWMRSSSETSIGRIVPLKPVEEWEEISQILDGGKWHWGDYILILDEASMLMSTRLHPALERYARTSPKDVEVILTTHRSVDLHPLFRSLATDWYLFNAYQERDLEMIADNMGKDVSEEVSKLPEYHLIHFWLDAGGVPSYQIWNEPEVWYLDIGRKS